MRIEWSIFKNSQPGSVHDIRRGLVTEVQDLRNIYWDQSAPLDQGNKQHRPRSCNTFEMLSPWSRSQCMKYEFWIVSNMLVIIFTMHHATLSQAQSSTVLLNDTDLFQCLLRVWVHDTKSPHTSQLLKKEFWEVALHKSAPYHPFLRIYPVAFPLLVLEAVGMTSSSKMFYKKN